MTKKVLMAILLLAIVGGLAYGAERESPKIAQEEQKGGTENGGPSNGVKSRAAGQSAECNGNKGDNHSAEISIESGTKESREIGRRQRDTDTEIQNVDRGSNRTSSITSIGTYTITAYTAGYESTGKTPSHPAYGITASGVKVRENHTIAADWTILPPGTTLKIEGLPHIYTVEDRGSAIKGNRLDIYIADLEAALKWGVQERKVIILEMGGK